MVLSTGFYLFSATCAGLIESMKGPELVLHISVMSSLLLVCRLELSVMLLQRHPGETERASTFFAERSQKKETFSELKKNI